MNSVAVSGARVIHKSSRCLFISRNLCDCSFDGNENGNEFIYVGEPLRIMWKTSNFDGVFDKDSDENMVKKHTRVHFSLRRSTFEAARNDAKRVIEILRKDGPGFDTTSALNELQVNVSEVLVREVFREILRNINHGNKTRFAKLGSKFFVWAGQQGSYRHTANSYHLVMKVFADCEEYRAMWRLLDEMIEKGFSTTAHTFNILICTCGEAGLARKVVEKFVKSSTFNFRPFKNSYNAILHSLLVLDQYKLIEWVYEQMLGSGHYPDILTYNIIIYTNYRLGKLDQFARLIHEMIKSGFSPDLHTYNILLHYFGKGAEPGRALNLLNHMKEVGVNPSVLHFTTLMDGLSRARKMDACKYFFDEMIENGCSPDVVSYTVIITGYINVGMLEKAQELFDEMISKGQLPNVFTYNSMIRGFCMAGKFEKACSMMKEMESRGCNPNFVVYSSLVTNLQRAGRDSDAQEIIKYMENKGKYIHLIPKITGFRRC